MRYNDDLSFETLRNENVIETNNELTLSFDSRSSASFNSFERLETEKGLFNLACTNARSLKEKIGSLVTLFEENDLHAALLTETWLTERICSKNNMDNLTVGANLSFIRRDRGSRGGGVAIVFNPTKIRLSKFQSGADKKKEVVCAIGNCSLTERKVALIAAYLSLIHI